MNYRDFKAAVALEANEPRDYEQIIFRAPDGIIYNNVIVDFGYWNNSKDKAIIVNLFNIKPKFKVGDIVCNNSGLYPNVKYTIAEVNEELEYYSYKEVNGRTYFKDQDKLMLVNGEEVRPPVEGEDKLDILTKSYADVVKHNTLKYNTEHYPHIANMIDIITRASNEGKTSCSFIFVDKIAADDSGVYYEEDEICNVIRWHFKELGFDVKENVNDKNNYVEFIISW